MKNLILNNWGTKLVALAIAIVLWFLIKKNIDRTSPGYYRPFQTDPSSHVETP